MVGYPHFFGICIVSWYVVFNKLLNPPVWLKHVCLGLATSRCAHGEERALVQVLN